MNKLSALEVSGAACLRGGRLVFRDLGFVVAAGRCLAVEGPNGAGKTSLLRMIAGFLAPAAGTVRLRSPAGDVEDGDERARFAGWLGHQDGIKPQLTVSETLGFFATLYGARIDIAAALDGVGLSRLADMPCQYLSAGQKKRLALARLRTGERPLWLLDEPLAALDADGKRLVANMIDAHCRAGGIAVAATHEALGIECTRLALGTT